MFSYINISIAVYNNFSVLLKSVANHSIGTSTLETLIIEKLSLHEWFSIDNSSINTYTLSAENSILSVFPCA